MWPSSRDTQQERGPHPKPCSVKKEPGLLPTTLEPPCQGEQSSKRKLTVRPGEKSRTHGSWLWKLTKEYQSRKKEMWSSQQYPTPSAHTFSLSNVWEVLLAVSAVRPRDGRPVYCGH